MPYGPPAESSSCPCSSGAIGKATVVRDLAELVRSTASASLLHLPLVDDKPSSGVVRQLFWLRKFRGVRMASAAAFPSCNRRSDTLSAPCDIPSACLLHHAPSIGRGRHAPAGLNLTRGRAAFWMGFAWHSQYAHWTLEHLPRMWYHLELSRTLSRPPVLVVPKSTAPWQLAVLRAISTPNAEMMMDAGGKPSQQRRGPPVLLLSPPHYFSTLYVPGMLAHIGVIWAPQAVQTWERLRALVASSAVPRMGALGLRSMGAAATQLLLNGGANRFGGSSAVSASRSAATTQRLFSLREAGGQSAGGARVLSNQQAIAAGLRALGFSSLHLDGLSLAQKLSAMQGATDVLFECGSSLANAMLLPAGARLILLCMRDHTSSRGCYMQLLASRFTNAPVITLRAGEQLPASTPVLATRVNKRNNVQPHAAWTMQTAPTLQAVASLAGLQPPGNRNKDGGDDVSWPPLPACALASTHTTPPAGPTPGPQPLSAPASQWWRAPEESFQPAPHLSPFRRSRVFALAPCASVAWDAPRCWELVKSRHRTKPGMRRTLEWRACALEAHCTRWRWCVRLRDGNDTSAADKYVNCEVVTRA